MTKVTAIAYSWEDGPTVDDQVTLDLPDGRLNTSDAIEELFGHETVRDMIRGLMTGRDGEGFKVEFRRHDR